jgi:phage I-like protein
MSKEAFIIKCAQEKISEKKSLEYAPSGTHTIHAKKNGSAAVVTVTVDEAAAQELDDNLQSWLKAAEAGDVSRPYIDFDHEGKGAAAIPNRFYWDDGIRLEVEWTSSGIDAVQGKNYSYFSPEVMIDTDTGKITGLPSHGAIGSLVNTPAFQNIKQLAAASTKTEPSTKMTIEEIQAKHDALEVKLAEAKEANATLQASYDEVLVERDAKVTELEASVAEVTTLSAKLETVREEKINAKIAAKNIKEENRPAVLAACLNAADDGEAVLAAFEAPAPGGHPPLKKEVVKAPEAVGLARLTAAISENLKAKAL